jgi:hypothetical protein
MENLQVYCARFHANAASNLDRAASAELGDKSTSVDSIPH